MSLFNILLLCFLVFPRIVLCKVEKIKLKISRIESQIESLDYDVKLLNIESAEMKTMITDINNTCTIGNNFANVGYKAPVISNSNMVSVDDSRIDIATRLMKAFKDEKSFNKKAILDLNIAQNDIIQKAKSLEKKTLDLINFQNKTANFIDSFKAETEHNFEKYETLVREAVSQMQELNSDIIQLNKRVTERISIRDANHQKLERQYDILSKKITTLELYAKPCDDPWIYNKILGKCYLFNSKRLTWSESVNFCKVKGGRLVEIQNDKIHASLKTMSELAVLDCGGGLYDGFWAGGFEQGSVWHWVGSNTKIKWKNWYPGEPSGGSQNKLCVMTNDVRLRWDDQHNSDKHPFICEKLTQ